MTHKTTTYTNSSGKIWWVMRRAEGNHTLARRCDRYVHRIDLVARIDLVIEHDPKVIYSV